MRKVIYDILLILVILPVLSSLVGLLLGSRYEYEIGYLGGGFVVFYFLKLRDSYKSIKKLN